MNRKHNKDIVKLLNDREFIQWLINPSPDGDEYWNKYIIEKGDDFIEDVKHLRSLLTDLRIDEPSFSLNEKNELKENILSKVNLETPTQRRRITHHYWVAAGIALLLGFSYFFISTFGKMDLAVDYQALMQNSDTVQTDKVALITDKEKVSIGSDSVEIKYNKLGQNNITSNSEEGSKVEKKPVFNQLIVPYGKTSSLTLSDGTILRVNSGTTVIYPNIFTTSKREIYVEGEVFLDVVANDKIPFIVKTSKMEVEVRGTTFNVSAYKDEEIQSVVLVTGKVGVKSGDSAVQEISPNQMYALNANNNTSQISVVDANEYISWINRYLYFKNKSFTYVFKKLEKYYNVHIVFDEQEMNTLHVNGKLDLKDELAAVLSNISAIKEIDYKVQDKSITVNLKKK